MGQTDLQEQRLSGLVCKFVCTMCAVTAEFDLFSVDNHGGDGAMVGRVRVGRLQRIPMNSMCYITD